MALKSLSEVAKEVGLSENIIQKCESAGVVEKPKGRNKYKYLQYSEKEIEKLWLVRFYKDMGYKNPQIKELLNSSAFDRNELLKEHIEFLEKKIEEDKRVLDVAKSMLDNGVTQQYLKSGIKDVSYDEALELKEAVLPYQTFENYDYVFESFFDKEKSEAFYRIISNINVLKKLDYDFDSEKVQEQVFELHKCLIDLISDSIYSFNNFAIGFVPGGVLADEIDEFMEAPISEFLYKACQEYVDRNRDSNPTDVIMVQSLKNITLLASKGFSPESEEIQGEIDRIYSYFSEMKYIPENQRIQMLLGMASLFETHTLQNRLMNGKANAFTEYLSYALRYYCKKIKQFK